MLRNYFKIAWRNLLRNKAFSAINIAGLAIGLATCLLILLYVANELSYDRFNEKADQIVRVTFGGKMSGETMKEAGVMAPVAQTLRRDYPEVLEATRLQNQYDIPKISYGEKTFQGGKMAAVDDNFFQVFTLPFLKGDPKTALMQPNTVVITEKLAQTYFGNDDPMGKLIQFKNQQVFRKITGVINEIPANSHFHFDMFSSMADVPDAKSTSFLSGTFFTYLVLPAGYDYKQLEAKLPQVTEKYISPQLKQAMGMTIREFRQKGNDIGLHLQPLTDIHLHSDFTNSLEANGDIRYVYIFGAIAVFMLLIACINFMNLSTAGASKRAKEVGIRKVLGSMHSELIGQFLFESILLVIIALVIATGLVAIALPAFNNLADTALTLEVTKNPFFVVYLFGFSLLVGTLAGSYPAFFLSAFKPISVLKSKFISNRNSISLRSGLVVFQFFISVMLIVGIIVVYKQLAYIQTKKLGFDKEQILVLRNTYLLGGKEKTFKDQLLKDSRIINVTNSAYVPAGPTNTNMTSTFPDGNRTLVRRTNIYQIDEQYIPTMGMEVVAGRNFSPDFPSDSSGVLVNETLAKIYGWQKNAVGHSVNFFTNNTGSSQSLRVIGVVKDFHFKSLHEEIGPVMLALQPSSGLILKVKTGEIAAVLSSLKTQWDTFNVGEPFAYSFLDQDFDRIYASEKKTGIILSIFTGLTIFVACLGLFGLATFTAEQRTKEIGVRKVLGASVSGIVMLLSKDFLKLVLIAILIASPVAWWAMNRWLQDFAYRIEIEWWVFAGAGLLAVGIALLTVSFQSIRAALMNPVKSLRSE